jgi:large subunit ribosomal protein L4|uniref:ribosomal protein L4 n=1 Tax=Cryptomonas pyrenoidifera TaxID=233184 RepID=UPI0022A67E03|nr:ribosomal protein L4 [Cryptomonas pyrenoidifera]UZS90628.1 ribosomal protein L4 [Cryptomonas pyrenoidifera]
MTILTQLNYEVRDSQGNIIPNKSVPLSLKINESAPKYLIHKAIVIQDRNRRQGNASCKTRSEVRGGGKKPWKQKGTGQARSGSSNSPLWKGGGVTFGPKPRSYEKKINIKEKQLALKTAFFNNMHKVVVIENLSAIASQPKTKDLIQLLKKLLLSDVDKKALIVAHEINENLTRSTRNLPNVELLYSHNLNLKEILLAKRIVITQDALTNLTQK